MKKVLRRQTTSGCYDIHSLVSPLSELAHIRAMDSNNRATSFQDALGRQPQGALALGDLQEGPMPAVRRPLRNDEAAALIGIKPITLKIWRVKGKGPRFVKLGDTKQSGVVYDEEDVLAWIARHKYRSTSAYGQQASSIPAG